MGLDHIFNELSGIKELSVEICVKRIHEKGISSIIEGFEIVIVFDEARFSEANLCLFSEIINQVLANLVSLNSFTVLKTSTIQNLEAWREWKPTRQGQSMI